MVDVSFIGEIISYNVVYVCLVRKVMALKSSAAVTLLFYQAPVFVCATEEVNRKLEDADKINITSKRMTTYRFSVNDSIC